MNITSRRIPEGSSEEDDGDEDTFVETEIRQFIEELPAFQEFQREIEFDNSNTGNN